MPRSTQVTLALGVWVTSGFRHAGAVIGMRPANDTLLGVNLPDPLWAPGFPALPAAPGLWILTCDVELPVAYDDEPEDEVFPYLESEQLRWLCNTAAWRQANQRDLYILRGEMPPGEEGAT